MVPGSLQKRLGPFALLELISVSPPFHSIGYIPALPTRMGVESGGRVPRSEKLGVGRSHRFENEVAQIRCVRF